MLHSAALITVYLPTTPGAKGVEGTLAAIRAQSLDAVGMCLLLDGDDSEIEALCAEAEDVALAKAAEGAGRCASLLGALAECKSEFAAVLYPGDQVEPGYLEALLASLKANEAARGSLATLGGVAAGAAAEEGAFARLLGLATRAAPAQPLRGLYRGSALRKAAAPIKNLANCDDTALIAELALSGPILQSGETVVPGAAAVPDPAFDAAGWGARCAQIAETALAVPAPPQDLRLLWISLVNRTMSPALAGPLFGKAGFTAPERDAAFEGFAAHMEASGRIDVPFLLDEDWERIKRWSKGFVWSPKENLTLKSFGPQPVNAGQPFTDKGSEIWLETESRIAPGSAIRLGGTSLPSQITLNRATAQVPAALTQKAAELPLVLVDASGTPLTKPETFWILRRTGLGRGVMRMLRRLRGQPEPGARLALPRPDENP